jgi:hypothetical protein
MSTTLIGRIDWSAKRDERTHRDYSIKWLVESNDPWNDGPQTVSLTAGLPAIGSYWHFGNENDPWAYCMPEWQMNPLHTSQGPVQVWSVEQTFSTRFMMRCATVPVENPLLEPVRVSGSFRQQKREKQLDRHGNVKRTSANELVSGSLIEADESHPTVTIEITTLSNQLAIFTPYMDTLNDRDLWGLAKRQIKLSGGNWSRKYWGVCTPYYVTTLEFHGHPRTWDKRRNDYGSICLNRTFWDPTADGYTGPHTDAEKDEAVKDHRNLTWYTDRNDEKAKCFLDGHGAPLPIYDIALGKKPLEFLDEDYDESNFLLLGVPSLL